MIAIRPKTGEIVFTYQYTPTMCTTSMAPTSMFSPICRSRPAPQDHDQLNKTASSTAGPDKLLTDCSERCRQGQLGHRIDLETADHV